MGVRNDGITLVDDVGVGASTPVSITSPIGPAAKAGSIPVTLATDEDDIPISNASLTSIDAKLPSALEGDRLKVVLPAGGGGLTDAELRATPVPVSGPLTDAQLRALSVPVDTELPPAAALADNTANPTVPGVSSFGMMFDGTNWDRLRGTSIDGLLVDLGTNNDVVITNLLSEDGIVSSEIGVMSLGKDPFDDARILRTNTLGELAVNIQNSINISGSISTKTNLIPSTPTAVSVGVASGVLVAANAARKGLRLVNTSNARISLGFGAPAVLDSGITLYPTGSFNMDEYDFSTGAINAIASAAASNVGVQEFT